MFEKILKVKETEKNTAYKEHTKAVNSFEKIATEMYEMLKKKETKEADLQQLIKSPGQITLIRSQAEYIESLNSEINHLQKRVQAARGQMENKKDILTKAHIEMKKMETIINNRKTNKEMIAKRNDMKLMDEMALQQYFSLK